MGFENVIKKLALRNGFELEPQPNGEMDLNPHVYDFAMALVGEHIKSDTGVKVGALVKVIEVDEMDRLIDDIRVGYSGVLVKIGPAGYHTVYLGETNKVAILYASQFKVEG
jgi:hypothetical protein